MDTKAFIEFTKETFKDNKFIPLHAPIFNTNEKKYLNETIDSTFVSSIGKYVDKFENHLEEITNSPKVVSTVNGTTALHESDSP